MFQWCFGGVLVAAFCCAAFGFLVVVFHFSGGSWLWCFSGCSLMVLAEHNSKSTQRAAITTRGVCEGKQRKRKSTKAKRFFLKKVLKASTLDSQCVDRKKQSSEEYCEDTFQKKNDLQPCQCGEQRFFATTSASSAERAREHANDMHIHAIGPENMYVQRTCPI